MSLPTNAEQEMLELINRSRANPAGEFSHLIQSLSPPAGVTPEITSAIMFFGVDLNLLRQQLQAYAPVAPLAQVWLMKVVTALPTASSAARSSPFRLIGRRLA